MHILVSAPSSWHTAPKTLSDENIRSIFCSNGVILGGLLGGGWSPEGPSHDFQLHAPHSPERGEGLEMKVIIDHTVSKPP